MANLRTEIDQLFLSQISSANLRYAVFPAAAPVAMVSDGAAAANAFAAYVQIVAAGAIADPSWLVGVILHTAVVETHTGDLAIASGGAGSEVDLAIIPYAAGLPAATALTTFVALGLPIWLPYPIKITGAPRLAGRIRKNTAASAAGGSLKVIVATSLGS